MMDYYRNLSLQGRYELFKESKIRKFNQNFNTDFEGKLFSYGTFYLNEIGYSGFIQEGIEITNIENQTDDEYLNYASNSNDFLDIEVIKYWD